MKTIASIIVCFSLFINLNGQIDRFKDDSKFKYTNGNVPKNFSGTDMHVFDIWYEHGEDIDILTKNFMFFSIDQWVYMLGYEPKFKSEICDEPNRYTYCKCKEYFKREVYLFKRHFDAPDTWKKATDCLFTHEQFTYVKNGGWVQEYTTYDAVRYGMGGISYIDKVNINGNDVYIVFFQEYTPHLKKEGKQTQNTTLLILKTGDSFNPDGSIDFTYEKHDLGILFVPQERTSGSKKYISAGSYGYGDGIKYSITFDDNLTFILHKGNSTIVYD